MAFLLKNSGMIRKEGEDCEKSQQRNHDIILSPLSLKIHRSEEHSSEASIRTKRNLKMEDFEFTSHQIISTTVLVRFWHKPETSIHSQKEEKTTLTYSSIFPQDMFSGTEVWNQHLGFISQSKLSEYLPANKSTYPWLLELIVLSSEANPTYNNNALKGWEVWPPLGALAPWVNMQEANRA